jgi:hypothetical protein
MTTVFIDVTFDPDERVQKVGRDIEAFDAAVKLTP